MTISHFVFLLDQSTPLVLGYNWLTCYNLLIDWVFGNITFHSQLSEKLNPPMSFARSAQLPPQETQISNNLSTSTSIPSISIISSVAFHHACRLPGAQFFQILLSDTSVSGKSASISDEPSDLSAFPKEYNDFADVFNKTKAETLAPHCPYDLKINLEEGASLPLSLMYSLSQSELKAFREFIDNNLCTGSICSTSSSHGAPVLFVHKEDSSL